VRTKTEEQADKILEAAGRLFGHLRFHEVRMGDIAAEAQVGKGTLYRYFRDKEELYLALLAQSSERFSRRVQAAAAGVEGVRRRLEAVLAAVIDHFDEQPHLFDLIQRAEVLNIEEVELPWRRLRQEVLQLYVDLLREGTERGEFYVADPELTGLLLLGGMRGVIRFGKQPRPRDLPRQIVAALVRPAVDCPSARRPGNHLPQASRS